MTPLPAPFPDRLKELKKFFLNQPKKEARFMTVSKKITNFAQPLKRSASTQAAAKGCRLILKDLQHFTK